MAKIGVDERQLVTINPLKPTFPHIPSRVTPDRVAVWGSSSERSGRGRHVRWKV